MTTSKLDAIREAMRVVIDPDLHQDIVTLGFVRDLQCDDAGVVRFELRLTTPACPVREQLEEQARQAALTVEGVTEVQIDVTAPKTKSILASAATDPSLAGVRHVILVGAGKGGVGKSTLATHLAWGLAGLGARVGLLDADVHGPSVVRLTGAEPPPNPQPEGLTEPTEIDGVAVVSMAMFLPARRPTLLRGPRVTSAVRQLMTGFAWGERDYLIVDCPPGTGDVHLTLAAISRVAGAVLVTTPQGVALDDTRRAATAMSMLKIPILGIAEMMSGFECPDCHTLHTIFGEGGGQALADELSVPLLGQIPLDPELVQAGEIGQILFNRAPSSPAARALMELAGQVARRTSIVEAERAAAEAQKAAQEAEREARIAAEEASSSPQTP